MYLVITHFWVIPKKNTKKSKNIIKKYNSEKRMIERSNFSLIRDNNFLSLHIFQIDHYNFFLRKWTIISTPYMCDILYSFFFFYLYTFKNYTLIPEFYIIVKLTHQKNIYISIVIIFN